MIPLLPGRTREPKNLLNQPDTDEILIFIEVLINKESDDICGAVERLSKARSKFTRNAFWQTACQTVGISTKFRESHDEYDNMTWKKLFATFCDFDREFVEEIANTHSIKFDDEAMKTIKNTSRQWAKKRKLYFDALRTGQFQKACLNFREEPKSSIFTKLLVFHTNGQYRWRKIEKWTELDQVVSNYEDVEILPFLDIDLTATYSQIDAYKKLINLPGIDINNKFGHFRISNTPASWKAQTALIFATAMGRRDIFDLLMNHADIDVNRCDTWDKSPLYWALARRQLEMVNLLLDRGAVVNGCRNALWAAVGIQNEKLINRLVDAAFNPTTDQAKLLTFFIHISTIPDGQPFIKPLMKYVNKEELINRIIDAIDLEFPWNLRFEHGKTLLMTAVEMQNDYAVLTLVRRGADMDLQDKRGNTALHIAAGNGFIDILSDLCNEGANLNLRNMDGQTALDVAKSLGHDDVVETLLAYNV